MDPRSWNEGIYFFQKQQGAQERWSTTIEPSKEVTTHPRPPEHTPGNPPTQPWKESLYSLFGKGLGVCSKGVLKQP